MDKETVRQMARLARRTLDKSIHQQASRRICQQLATLPDYPNTRHIGCYAAIAHEVNIMLFITQAHQDQKSLYLPIIGANATMQMHAYQPGDSTLTNAHNIPEPQPNQPIATTLDWLIVPLVGFDMQGNRIGQGGGYYDRFLKKLSPACRRIGVAFECQQVTAIAADQWDMKLDCVVTEKMVYDFSKTP